MTHYWVTMDDETLAKYPGLSARDNGVQPVHALNAHRPLGSIMRARMAVYKQTAAFREASNGTTRSEPRSFANVPD